jgi:hypothetical protein
VEILLGGSRFDLPGGGELRILDQLGGSRSDLPGGGELGFCDRTCSVVANQSSVICSVEVDRCFAWWWRSAAP